MKRTSLAPEPLFLRSIWMNKAIYDALAKLSPNKAQPFDLRADGDIKGDLSTTRRQTSRDLSGVSDEADTRDDELDNMKCR